MTFVTGPKFLRPQREDEQRSFFDRAKPYYVGIWAENAQFRRNPRLRVTPE